MGTIKKTNGFTMVEIIIVLVILGVLCAVALPTMLGLIDETQAKVCLTQRSTGEKTLASYIEMNGNKDIDAQIEKAMLDINATKGGNGYEGVCPTKGIYVVDKGDFSIICSEHGDDDSIIKSSIGVSYLFESQRFKEYFIYETNPILDSTGKNYGVIVKQQIADKYDIDPDSYDFKVVYDKSKKEYRVYISESLNGKKTGDTVSVTGYVYKGNEIVQAGTSQTTTVSDRTINGIKYNLITDNVEKTYVWN